MDISVAQVRVTFKGNINAAYIGTLANTVAKEKPTVFLAGLSMYSLTTKQSKE